MTRTGGCVCVPNDDDGDEEDHTPSNRSRVIMKDPTTITTKKKGMKRVSYLSVRFLSHLNPHRMPGVIVIILKTREKKNRSIERCFFAVQVFN